MFDGYGERHPIFNQSFSLNSPQFLQLVFTFYLPLSPVPVILEMQTLNSAKLLSKFTKFADQNPWI